MAIKEVDYIPRSNGKKRMTFTQMVRDDINEAFDKHISKFEFVGEYNYKTLAPIVREQTRHFYTNKIYVPAERAVKLALLQEGYTEIKLPLTAYRDSERVFRVKSITGEDRIHVYVEIDFDYLQTYRETLLEETKLLSKKRVV